MSFQTPRFEAWLCAAPQLPQFAHRRIGFVSFPTSTSRISAMIWWQGWQQGERQRAFYLAVLIQVKVIGANVRIKVGIEIEVVRLDGKVEAECGNNRLAAGSRPRQGHLRKERRAHHWASSKAFSSEAAKTRMPRIAFVGDEEGYSASHTLGFDINTLLSQGAVFNLGANVDTQVTLACLCDGSGRRRSYKLTVDLGLVFEVDVDLDTFAPQADVVIALRSVSSGCAGLHC